MLVGLGMLLAVLSILPQQASVLYTFYPPLVAPPMFYIGLVLLVVGSWCASANVFLTYLDWRKEHAGERAPLAVFAAVCNYLMWDIATIGVAIEVLFMLLPASLGWIQTTDPQLGRVLFWFFGHPLVYFWLIPAYISWYTMLPKQAGGKLFSEPLARVSFLLLVIFSIPVGVHHLFSDPGVSATAKGIHTILTFVVAVPSFMTAFNLGASLEYAGRKNGGKGLFGWIWHQK
jgi:cytochrome c oxidase subunit 1